MPKQIRCYIPDMRSGARAGIANMLGEQEACAFYVIALAAPDLPDSTQSDLEDYERYLASFHLPDYTLRVGPLIRGDAPFEHTALEERRRLFNLLFRLARKLPVRFATVAIPRVRMQGPRSAGV